MKDIICGIYKITNRVNNKVYIGKSIDILNKRWPSHKNLLNNGTHGNTHLQNSWNKYGEENFDFSIIFECPSDELDKYEIDFISAYKSYCPDYGYNKTYGGDGAVPTDETREKMSISHIGILGTPESKAKQSAKLSGPNNPMYGLKKEMHPAYGKVKSDETIQKIKDSWTDERKRIQSQRISGKNNPMSECFGSLNPSAKNVVCVETGDSFETLKDAAMWCGLKTHTNISNCCRGLRKHAGKHPITGEKLSWRYAD